MTFQVQQKRSKDPNKRPTAVDLLEGQLAVNFDTGSTGLFFKTDLGQLVKVGPVALGASAPAPDGGVAQLAIGEQWLNTGNNTLNVWNGTSWLAVTGSGIVSSGDATFSQALSVAGNVTMSQKLKLVNNYTNKAAAGVGSLGDIAVIGGSLCFHNGVDWKILNLGISPA